MKTTRTGPVPPYIGADLTDRYSSGCRPVDVCGLTPIEEGLFRASFWQWEWDPASQELDVKSICEELTVARCSMLDAPQGLADPGKLLRVCEEKSRAPGRTPDRRSAVTGTYKGFILSSLDIFQALRDAGTTISPPGFVGGVNEVFPGHIWRILAGVARLPKKQTPEGRKARKAILKEIGVQCLPVKLTDDQNDACIAAIIAAAADGKVAGMSVERIGKELYRDETHQLREGPMAIPSISEELRRRLDELLGRMLKVKLPQYEATHYTPPATGEPAQRATELLGKLVAHVTQGNPVVCSYSWAYNRIFEQRWSRNCTSTIVSLGERTGPVELPGLGFVHLDAFIVAAKSRKPGEGHWKGKSTEYKQHWYELLGAAKLLHEKRDSI